MSFRVDGSLRRRLRVLQVASIRPSAVGSRGPSIPDRTAVLRSRGTSSRTYACPANGLLASDLAHGRAVLRGRGGPTAPATAACRSPPGRRFRAVSQDHRPRISVGRRTSLADLEVDTGERQAARQRTRHQARISARGAATVMTPASARSSSARRPERDDRTGTASGSPAGRAGGRQQMIAIVPKRLSEASASGRTRLPLCCCCS